ncbi:hypothetical protein B0H66DRAFT_9588 [Apodospora peruviana]|uniref:Uncharacterized protein n=1 Tax=Apodospora peruviana TaxID=516989 RepID=A0AAE0IPI3_9PEZI|nr:hypothetical protein B0H66DRAFT_9588 [Apodospora peruviana]
MRFTSIIVTGALALVASAQSTTTTTNPPTTTDSATAAANSAQAAILACLDACKPGDVDCTSKCIAVPNPNASQVNETNKCVAACPQGSGSASDNKVYGDCVNKCIGQYYFTTDGTPTPTGAAGGSSGNGNTGGDSDSNNNGGSAGPSGTVTDKSSTGPSNTNAAATSSTSGAAAAPGALVMNGAGALGFLAALLAI